MKRYLVMIFVATVFCLSSILSDSSPLYAFNDAYISDPEKDSLKTVISDIPIDRFATPPRFVPEGFDQCSDSLQAMLNVLIHPDQPMQIPVSDDVMDYVKSGWSHWNKEISDTTVRKFVEVATHFDFIDHPKFEYFVAQIVHESGAQQYYRSTHKSKAGQLVVSSGNAVGITQITPTTAFHYLRYVVDSLDFTNFERLGASSIKQIQQKSYKTNSKGKRYICSETRKMINEWLTSETNNLILWGYITQHYLNQRGDNVDRVLVAYKDGSGYLNKYLKDGKSPSDHSYVKVIRNIKSKIDEEYEPELDATSSL